MPALCVDKTAVTLVMANDWEMTHPPLQAGRQAAAAVQSAIGEGEGRFQHDTTTTTTTTTNKLNNSER